MITAPSAVKHTLGGWIYASAALTVPTYSPTMYGFEVGNIGPRSHGSR